MVFFQYLIAMPKYYIKSGDIKFIVDSKNTTAAIKKMIAFYKHKKPKPIKSNKICISEIGFDSFKSWKCFEFKDFI
jgi:hypothetical protein